MELHKMVSCGFWGCPGLLTSIGLDLGEALLVDLAFLMLC